MVKIQQLFFACAIFLNIAIIRSPHQQISGMNGMGDQPLTVEQLEVHAAIFLAQAANGDKLVVEYPRAVFTYQHPSDDPTMIWLTEYEKKIKHPDKLFSSRSGGSQYMSAYKRSRAIFSAHTLAETFHERISDGDGIWVNGLWVHELTYDEQYVAPLDENNEEIVPAKNTFVETFTHLINEEPATVDDLPTFSLEFSPLLPLAMALPCLAAGVYTTLKAEYEEEKKSGKNKTLSSTFSKYVLQKTISFRGTKKHKLFNTGRFLASLAILRLAYLGFPQPFNATTKFCSKQVNNLLKVIK
jgi:hypothetical protein